MNEKFFYEALRKCSNDELAILLSMNHSKFEASLVPDKRTLLTGKNWDLLVVIGIALHFFIFKKYKENRDNRRNYLLKKLSVIL